MVATISIVVLVSLAVFLVAAAISTGLIYTVAGDYKIQHVRDANGNIIQSNDARTRIDVAEIMKWVVVTILVVMCLIFFFSSTIGTRVSSIGKELGKSR